jgi:chromosome condensin MukBEF ATPase and DNA-binding subunit MukB
VLISIQRKNIGAYIDIAVEYRCSYRYSRRILVLISKQRSNIGVHIDTAVEYRCSYRHSGFSQPLHADAESIHATGRYITFTVDKRR